MRRESIGEHDVRDAWTTEALFEACGPQLEAFLKAKDEAERAAAEDARAGEAEAEAIGGDESIAESFANGAVAATSTSATAFEALPGYETSVRVLVPSAAASDASIVKKGSGVTVHATGVVEQTGETFWSTKDPGQTPFSYVAGVGAVIVGWDQAVLRRKAGETLEARIPAKEGYGEGGFPAWGIPPGGTLRFTIEVLSVENAG